MIARRVMAWLFPRHAAESRQVDAAINEALLATSETGRAADDMAASTDLAVARAQAVADDASERLARQETRRLARERAVRDRGIAAAVDDLLNLPSFGGPGDRKG